MKRPWPLLLALAADCSRSQPPAPAARPSTAPQAPAAPATTAPTPAPTPAPAPATFAIRSAAFAEGGAIPPVHARNDCGDGAANRSPALTFTSIPPNARSLALIVDDPDAPDGTFTHWVVYNMGLREALPEGATVEMSSIQQGQNDFGEAGYGGPCPPPGAPHRYVFRLYALDVERLDLRGEVTAAALRAAMQGHVVATAEATGRYGR